MRTLLVLLTLGAVAPLGCTGRTAPLDGLRSAPGAVAGAGGPSDAGASDAGLAVSCRFDGAYRQQARVDLSRDLPSAYDGLARLRSREPLMFELEGGEMVRLSLGATPLPEALVERRILWLTYRQEGLQVTSTFVGIWEVVEIERGQLRVAAWAFDAGGEVGFDFDDDVEARYEPDPCTPVRLDCGPARPESLVVVAPGVDVRVPAGEVRRIRTAEVANGQSRRFVSAPQCPATPTVQNEGYVVFF